jgi:ubiquinone/menaquinone biosynthesis C-methylase UbiE
MERVPEPELMLDDEQARAYAAADFDAPHSHCIELLRQAHPDLPAQGRALDLGCGPGDITIRLARALPAWRIDAVDGAPAMLELAQVAAARAGVQSRIRWWQAVLPSDELHARTYDLVVATSLLHHLSDPAVLWSAATRCAAAGAALFVMDLLRPPSIASAHDLVERYAGDEPEVLRRDFFNSLCAAYRPAEVRAQLGAAGIEHLAVQIVSDRHLIAWGRL